MSAAADAKRFKEKLNADMPKFMRALALEAVGRIARRTPVDTGRARGNWQTTLGRPAVGTIEVEGSPAAMSALAVSRAKAAVAGYKSGDIHIVNNLPYIGNLENGSSRQAPSGMVQVTVAELQPLADRIGARIVRT